jgi:hypothetical protein
MNIGYYIRILIPEHDTIIIPGLGAFLSKYKPAQLDEKSGEMLPPSREITFEPRIRNNDGLLAGKIAAEEGISLTQAYRDLEIERDEILYRLDKGETVVFEGIGGLAYSDELEILFTPAGKDNLLLDAYGLESANLTNEPEDVQTDEPEPEQPSEQLQTKDAFEEKPSLVYSGASFKDKNTPPGKRNRAWWLLLFLIPVIGALIYIITNDTQEMPPAVEVRIEEPAPKESIPLADTVVTDTIPVQEEAAITSPEVITDTIAIITPDVSRFYLIRGSYEEFENADKFARRLKKQGYEPFHLGKQGSFYLVGIDSFDNEIQAYGQQYNYLDKYPESGVWIFTSKKDSIINQ